MMLGNFRDLKLRVLQPQLVEQRDLASLSLLLSDTHSPTHPRIVFEDKAKDKNIRGGEFGAEVLNLFMTNVFLSCQRQFDS